MPISKLDTPRALPTPSRQSAREMPVSQPLESSVAARPGFTGASSFDAGKAAAQAGSRGGVTVTSFHDVLEQPTKKQQALLAAGNEALAKGDYAAARKSFEALKELPDVQLKLLGSDTSANADGTHDHPAVGKGVNNSRIDDGSFQISSAELASRGLAQAEQLERMSTLTGKKPFNPHSMEHVQAYFKAFAKGKDTAAVSAELGAYMKNFYAHAGPKGTVTWDETVARKDRPANASHLLAHQPTDKAGRKIVNCEGFAFIAAAALRDVKTADGKPRFETYSVGGDPSGVEKDKSKPSPGSGHEIAYVFDNDSKPKGKAFKVNNEVTTMETNAHDSAAKREAVARSSGWQFVKYA